MIEFGQESSGAIQTRRMGRMLANFQSKNDNSLQPGNSKGTDWNQNAVNAIAWSSRIQEEKQTKI